MKALVPTLAVVLLRADYETANREIFSGTDQSTETVRKTFRALVARLELEF